MPTGIATDATTAPFFAALVSDKRLAQLIDFENRDAIFPAVHRSYKFSLLTFGRNVKEADFAFFLADTRQLAEFERRFTLSADEIARINPNTKTAPIFRSRADAALTAKIYARVPVLIDEAKGSVGNPWGAKFHTHIWHMAEDPQWFRTAEQLAQAGFVREGNDWATRKGAPPRQHALELPDGHDDRSLALVGRADTQDPERYVPLYEAKMMHHFDHRWATYDGVDSRDATATEKVDPCFEPTPRYWVPEHEVATRLVGKDWTRAWLMGWRKIARTTHERSLIASVFPRAAAGDSLPLCLPDIEAVRAACLLGCLCSLVTDYCERQKLGGTNLTFQFLFQLPVLPPSAYGPADLAFIVPRVLELTYTSHSMAPFARDLGYQGAPFPWDEVRRAQLRYILDPADVRGPIYPSETFRVLRSNEIKRHGEYRTARLVLTAWHALEKGSLRDDTSGE